MSKTFLPEITYMRGLCMLGVIGIHVGSYALSNPFANPYFIALLEILSRFSIPTFFFLSAFGLFYHTPVEGPFSYKNFMKRRLGVVLIPYIAWSLLYTAYNGLMAHTTLDFHPRYLLPSLLFGNGSYHLYFLVIILWFYLLMPLWRYVTKVILHKPILWLTILFIAQTAFNYYASYHIGKIHFDSPLLQYLLDMRLNYWVIHYVWVFLLGAVVAEKYDAFTIILREYSGFVVIGFALSVVAMLGSYFYVLHAWHYTLLEAIYTIHQLSPMGMFYTAMSILFFIYVFQVTPLTYGARAIWDGLGNYSYGMYLIHPFLLYWITPILGKLGLLYTIPVVSGLYIIVVLLAFYMTNRMMAAPKGLRKLLLGN